MKWPIFAIAVYVLVALQVSLASAMRFETAGGVVEPMFMLALLVFVGLSATPRVVVVAAVVMGVVLDATMVWPMADGRGMTVLGPFALGYLAGGVALLQIRPMVFRQHPLAYAVMILFAGFAVQLVVVGLFSVRIWYDPMADFAPASQLFLRTLSVFYSAVVGALLSVPLVAASSVFGFTTTKVGRRR
ncbi:MAG: hypothetical protein WD294_10760 [Phycisphaeraceae bacterium]